MLRDDEVHWHVVRLSVNRGELGFVVADADSQDAGVGDGKRAIVVAAAVTQAITRRVVADEWYQHCAWHDDAAIRGYRDVPESAPHRRAGPPFPELEGRILLDDDGQRCDTAFPDVATRQIAQVGLGADRPIETEHGARGQVQCREQLRG